MVYHDNPRAAPCMLLATVADVTKTGPCAETEIYFVKSPIVDTPRVFRIPFSKNQINRIGGYIFESVFVCEFFFTGHWPERLSNEQSKRKTADPPHRLRIELPEDSTCWRRREKSPGDSRISRPESQARRLP
jgi:hypothetical protein